MMGPPPLDESVVTRSSEFGSSFTMAVTIHVCLLAQATRIGRKAVSTALHAKHVMYLILGPGCFCAAYAGHTVLSASFPWLQPGTYDLLIEKQLKNVSDKDRDAAEAVAAPIAVELLKAR